MVNIDEACLWSIGWAMLSSGRGGAMLGTLARGAVSIIRSAMCVLFTTRKGQKTVTSLAYMALLACICQRPPYVMHVKAHTFTMRLSGGTRHLWQAVAATASAGARTVCWSEGKGSRSHFRATSLSSMQQRHLVLEAQRQSGCRSGQGSCWRGHTLAQENLLRQPEPWQITQSTAAHTVINSAWWIMYGHPALCLVVLQAPRVHSHNAGQRPTAVVRHCHALMLKGAAMRVCNAKQGAALRSDQWTSEESFSGHTRIGASWHEGQPGSACTWRFSGWGHTPADQGFHPQQWCRMVCLVRSQYCLCDPLRASLWSRRGCCCKWWAVGGKRAHTPAAQPRLGCFSGLPARQHSYMPWQGSPQTRSVPSLDIQTCLQTITAYYCWGSKHLTYTSMLAMSQARWVPVGWPACPLWLPGSRRKPCRLPLQAGRCTALAPLSGCQCPGQCGPSWPRATQMLAGIASRPCRADKDTAMVEYRYGRT